MTDHELDRLADKVAERVTAAPASCLVCRDSKAAAQLIRMAQDWDTARRAGIGAVVVLLCGAFAGALWLGFKAKIIGS